MAHFPREEPRILALLDEMIHGYVNNPILFPRADVDALEAAREEAIAAMHEQQQKKAEALSATKRKSKAITHLKKLMALQIKQSEVDAANDPTQLTLIGWGKRKKKGPMELPAQPGLLKVIDQGVDSVALAWKLPAKGEGGAVEMYRVERRMQEKTGGEFGLWQEIATSLKRKIFLGGQPRYVQMEYRIIAVNAGGSSVPGNSVVVVL